MNLICLGIYWGNYWRTRKENPTKNKFINTRTDSIVKQCIAKEVDIS